MLQKILKLSKNQGIKVDKSARRHLSFRGLKRSVDKYFESQAGAPYSHVCQIGDPVLRVHAQPVEPEIIQSPEFQRVIKWLTDVMRSYGAMGLAANQIGLSHQMFAMEITGQHLANVNEEFRKSRQMELTPLKVFVNPKMKVLDYAKILDTENCLSLIGYQAVVPRAKTVEIEAFDAMGERFVWKAHGWSARIIQHEMDHLQGKTYVDRMDPGTLECMHWSDINARRGNLILKYFPSHWLRRYLPF